MQYKVLTSLAAAAAVIVGAGAAQADTVVFNSTPTDTWYYGGGNDYAPANTAVLTTDAGDELYLRAHERLEVAPASDGNVYSFALGTTPLNFDWGFDTLATGVTALITVKRYGVGSISYDPLALGNDNELANGSTQNSFQLNWTGLFDPNVDSSYNVKLAVNGLSGGPKTLDIRVDMGAGYVPEPATWALMIMGFGGAGAVLRRRRALVAA